MARSLKAWQYTGRGSQCSSVNALIIREFEWTFYSSGIVQLDRSILPRLRLVTERADHLQPPAIYFT